MFAIPVEGERRCAKGTVSKFHVEILFVTMETPMLSTEHVVSVYIQCKGLSTRSLIW